MTDLVREIDEKSWGSVFPPELMSEIRDFNKRIRRANEQALYWKEKYYDIKDRYDNLHKASKGLLKKYRYTKGELDAIRNRDK